jgi:hydrogenase nickel incorporation protein HypA/HybF
MHEFSLCLQIVKLVKAAVREKQKRITTVRLVIGELVAIDIESLIFWFPVVCQKNFLKGVALEITMEKALGQCRQCQQEFSLKHLYDACPGCRAYDIEVLAGKSFFVSNIEVM